MMGRSLMGLPGSELAVGEEKAAGDPVREQVPDGAQVELTLGSTDSVRSASQT